MLEQFREFGNKKIVRFIFAIFLIIPFGLFGIDYYFRSPVGGDTLATVGRTRIGNLDFDQALRQQAEVYRQQFRGNFDASIMDNPEIRRAVLDRLVNERLVAVGSERAGIRLSDQQLAERIVSEPAFQVDGSFSKERYEQIARSMNLSPAGLDERLRQDFREQQFRGAIVDTAFVPQATLDGFIRLSEQIARCRRGEPRARRLPGQGEGDARAGEGVLRRASEGVHHAGAGAGSTTWSSPRTRSPRRRRPHPTT